MSNDQLIGVDRGGDHDPDRDHMSDHRTWSTPGRKPPTAKDAVGRADAEDALALAAAVLESACSGWRRNRRCVDEHGNRVAHTHPICLHAQYRHYMILLEHGLTIPAGRPSGVNRRETTLRMVHRER